MAALSPLIPLAYYGLASILTIHCLREPRHVRAASALPVLALSLAALSTAKELSWPFGLDSTFASVVVFYLPYSAKLLLLDAHPSDPEHSSRPWTFVECYRIWNNPRGLVPLGGTQTTTRARFLVRQLSIAAGLWAFDAVVFQTLLVLALLNVKARDFSPGKELPVLTDLSARELRVRAILSVQWCWSAYFLLEFYHCLLSVVFVCLLRFDRPGEWPGLYGSFLEADSIRGFWGRFWHRLTIPTYLRYAHLVCRRGLGLTPESAVEKTIVPFIIFTLSGLSHSLVGWALGDAALSRDLLFFEVNFAAAAVETLVSKAIKSGALPPLPQTKLPRRLRRALGIMYVFSFFFCVAPVWVYPKVHAKVVGVIR